jgi:hypothetical protein
VSERRALAIAIAVVVAIFALALLRSGPPSPAGADAPRDRFSATRARETQRALAALGPRPCGSDANARGRALLVDALSRAGWKTEERAGFACGKWAVCAFVHDVVATREGTDPSAAPILMSAHHDSVPASPGANDDASGCAAVVEAARAITDGPPLRRTVVAVLTDAEEDGLLGAESFAATDPIAKRVVAAVNVDSRGGSGTSAMFETSPDNAWLVALYARSVPDPTSSSLFYEVYKRMPNDTDFSVWRRSARGINLANTRAIEDYHTAIDDIDHADPGTLQQHGDALLATTRALASSPELDSPPAGDAAWFDVFHAFVVRWPAPWSRPLALSALALLVAHAFRRRGDAKTEGTSRRGVVFALATPAATIVSGLAAAAGAGVLLHAIGATPTPWIAHPVAALICLHFTCITAALASARVLGRLATPRAVWAASWALWAAAGAAMPSGASFVLFVPALVAALAAFHPRDVVAYVAPIAVAALLWTPLLLALYDGLGLALAPLVVAPSALLASVLAPLARATPKRTPLVTGGIALVALAAAAIVPTHTPDHPLRVNVMHVQDESHARAAILAHWGWMAWGAPPKAMVDALGQATSQRIATWLPDDLAADAPRVDLRPPSVTAIAPVVEESRRRVRFHVAAPSRTIVLELPFARLVSVAIDGHEARGREGVVTVRGVPAEGMDVEVVATGAEPIDLAIDAISEGLPEGSLASRVAAARPANAVPSQDGDRTMLTVHTKL